MSACIDPPEWCVGRRDTGRSERRVQPGLRCSNPGAAAGPRAGPGSADPGREAYGAAYLIPGARRSSIQQVHRTGIIALPLVDLRSRDTADREAALEGFMQER